jgi:hypothetical protein
MMRTARLAVMALLAVSACDRPTPATAPQSPTARAEATTPHAEASDPGKTSEHGEALESGASRSPLSVSDGARGSLPWTTSTFSFVLEEQGRSYLVLDEALLSEKWRPETLTVLDRDTTAEATFPADQVAEHHRALQGRSFDLYGPDGVLCTARVEAIVGLARLNAIEYIAVDLTADSTDADYAREVWNAGNRLLTARLATSDQVGCEGASWAREASSSPPVQYTSVELDRETHDQIVKLFRDLPGYRNQQQLYAGYFKDLHREQDTPFDPSQVSDWASTEYAEMVLTAFDEPDSQRRYVHVLGQGEGGCGAPNTEFWAIFVRDYDKSVWKVVTDPSEPGSLFHPAAAFDANLDGKPEFVSQGKRYTTFGADFDRQLVEFTDGIYRQTRQTEFPFYGCRC